VTLSSLVADGDHEAEPSGRRFDSPSYEVHWRFPPASFHAQFARYWLRACLTSWLGGEADRHTVECLFADLLAAVADDATEPIAVTVDISPETITCRLRRRRGTRTRDYGTVRASLATAAARTSAPLRWGSAYERGDVTCWFAATVPMANASPAVRVGDRPAVPVLDEMPCDRDAAW
jgi:hypothetical protein